MNGKMLLSVVVLLSACQIHEVSEGKAGPRPTDPAKTIRAYLKEILSDPDSLTQFAVLSTPKPCEIGRAPLPVKAGWCVDYEFNSKNRMGGYEGKRTYVAIIRNDRVTSWDADQASMR